MITVPGEAGGQLGTGELSPELDSRGPRGVLAVSGYQPENLSQEC